MNNEPAALLESDRHSSFHLWGKSREYEHGRSHEGRNGDGRERFDHLIPDSKDDCTEASIVPVLVLLLPLALSTTALCSGVALSVASKRSRGFLRGLLHVSSVAAGADAHAHAGNADADTATFFIAAALDVALARSVVPVGVAGVADDDALITAFTPAPAVFVADHADVLDVAVLSYRSSGSERCSGGGGCEQRSCAHCKRDCYFFHDDPQPGGIEVF